MLRRVDHESALAILEEAPLKNIVTLKVLRRQAASMTLRLFQRDRNWALLSLLPVHLSDHWDRKAYAEAEFIVFIDGNSNACKSELLDLLPSTNLVLKTGDEFLKGLIALEPDAARVSTFVSFTTSRKTGHANDGQDVRRSSSRDGEAWRLFRENGYEEDELALLFSDGAQWFGTYVEDTLAAACFVFPNHRSVWEIGGVNTQPQFRRRGLGRALVEAALDYLLGKELVPRYQAREDNAASIRLAGSCGLAEYMRVDHFLLRRAPQ